MKKLEEFLSELCDLDIRLWIEADKVRYSAPEDTMTAELLVQLRERKTEILTFLKENQSSKTTTDDMIQPFPRENHTLPLSFAQQRLWFLDQLVPNNPFYNIPMALELSGPLQKTVLEQTLNEIVQRHEILRTNLTIVDGKPVQVIHPFSDDNAQLSIIHLQHLSIEEQNREVQRFLKEDAQTPFDLSQDALFRTTLLQKDVESHILVLNMHHIISDGWSINILVHELSTIYEFFLQGKPSPLPPLRIQYADFAQWQRQWFTRERLEKQLNYWKQQLEGAPSRLALPTDHPRPPVQTFQGTSELLQLSSELTEPLKNLSLKSGTTLFMTLLSAFAILLSRYTAMDDIVIGFPSANRIHSQLEPLIGFFVNALPLRIDLKGNPQFDTLLQTVKRITLEAYANQDIPFEKLVEELEPERNMSYSPLFQVAFVFQKTPLEKFVFSPGLTMTPLIQYSVMAKFDITLYIHETSHGLLGILEYNTDLFERATIKRMIGHFQTLIESILANPQQPIHQLPLLTTAEYQQLLAWNDTATDYPQDQCIHQLFETQVEKKTDAIALVFENQQLTYQALNQRANQLAHHLRTLGVKPEVLVGICVERSLEMIVGLLGILKAGGAYVPLDPTYPKNRLTFMLTDAKVQILVTQKPLLAIFTEHHLLPKVCLDTDWQAIAQHSTANLKNLTLPKNMAYVIYTSGSTGKPKGVMVEHRSLCNLTTVHAQILNSPLNNRIIQLASVNFDSSVWEIVMALLSGSVLYLAPSKALLPGKQLVQLLRHEAITIMTLPPSALAILPIEDLPALKTIIVAGEACPTELAVQWSSNHHFFNGYGPTETTVGATIGEIKAWTDHTQKLPIGFPFANTQVYVLDTYLQSVPIGIIGELYVGGIGLARGYLNRPELTVEKFIPNPFSDNPKARLYKTGDLARYLPDGNLEFIGRIDNQVKIRGFRIELGEIEAIFNQDSTVQEAVVIVREDEPGQKRLVAYLISKLIPDRLPIQSACQVKYGDEPPIELQTEDISCYGVGLNGIPPTWQPNQSVHIQLQLSEVTEELWLAGRVAWCQGKRAGIQFASLSRTENTQVCQTIEQLFKTQGFLKVIQRTSVSHLREVLKDKLPSYMVPSSFVFLSTIPLTPNGKVDHQALPPPEELPIDKSSYLAPHSEIERQIAAIWKKLLHREKIGVHDNFFDLGGNSLLVVQVQQKLVEVLNQEIPIIKLFQYPTISHLSHYLEKSNLAPATINKHSEQIQKEKMARHQHHAHHLKTPRV
jgi:amino acid adenylation domain-containing protein